MTSPYDLQLVRSMNMEILEHDDDDKEDLVVEDVVVKVASQVDRAKHDLS